MKRAKILFRSGSLRMGGLERVLIEVLQNINKKDLDIHLLIDDNEGEQDVFKKDIPADIPFHFLQSREFMLLLNQSRKEKNKSLFHKLIYNFHMQKSRKICETETLQYISNYGPFDVIVDYDAGATRYIEKIPISNKVVWIHNSIPRLLKKSTKIKHFGKRLEKYTTIVAICDDMKEELKTLYPKVSHKVTRIYNPFDFQRIELLQEDTSHLTTIQQELLKKEYCLMVSRLSCVQKDYPTLLQAFQKVKKSGLSDLLYIIGDGPDKDTIQQMIQELHLENSVYLLGLTKNPYIWMKHSKLLVHASKYEGFGLVLVEALACGRMVISSNCPTGPREILNHETCGKLVPVEDVDALAEALIHYLSSENARKEKEKNIFSAKNRFAHEVIMKEYENLLFSLIDKETL
ncbi:glycosyltransferase [Fusobacterium necrophorum]|uniref:glycosyltransferase n=1 Tax=Fusobacterium necrophorum TaxID=859 RepID=UPI003FA0F2EE